MKPPEERDDQEVADLLPLDRELKVSLEAALLDVVDVADLLPLDRELKGDLRRAVGPI